MTVVLGLSLPNATRLANDRIRRGLLWAVNVFMILKEMHTLLDQPHL